MINPLVETEQFENCDDLVMCDYRPRTLFDFCIMLNTIKFAFPRNYSLNYIYIYICVHASFIFSELLPVFLLFEGIFKTRNYCKYWDKWVIKWPLFCISIFYLKQSKCSYAGNTKLFSSWYLDWIVYLIIFRNSNDFNLSALTHTLLNVFVLIAQTASNLYFC